MHHSSQEIPIMERMSPLDLRHSTDLPKRRYIALTLYLVSLIGCVEPVTSGETVINPGLGGTTGGTEVNGGTQGGGEGGGSANPSDGRPQLMRIGDKIAIVGQLLSIRLVATDPQNDLLTFSLRSAIPSGAKFEKDQGLFTWTPTPDQIGSVLLTFEVSDGTLKDQETIAVRVSAAGSQEQFPPEIDPIGSLLINAGEAWTYQLVGEDLNNQPLTYRLNGTLPQGLMLNAMTGLISWTPMESQIGQYELIAAVSDGESEATTPMVIIVQDRNSQSSSNRPPVFNPLPPQQVVAGQNLSFELSAMDEMPMALMFQADMLPEGADFNPGLRRFSWTPSPQQGGTSHDAVFVVSDGEYRAFLSVSIEVTRSSGACPSDPAGMSGGSFPLTAGMILQGRVLCNRMEIDNYEITLDRPGRIDATATFLHADGDIDLYLYDIGGQRLAFANGYLDEERLTSSNLMPGRYRLEAKIYSGDGPSVYSIGYSVLEGSASCEPDRLENGGNNTPQSATPILAYEDYTLSLCAGDIDYYNFYAARGELIEIYASFGHALSDIDLRLIAPNGSTGMPFQEWYAASENDNEQIIVESAPIEGTYILEVKQIAADREPQYDLRLNLTMAAECENDRLEPSDSAQNSYFASPNLYRDLRACADEDWFRTQVDAGRNLIIYLTYDEGTPIVSAQGPNGQITPVAQTFFSPVDGCVTDRFNCKRFEINPGFTGGEVRYGVSFFELDVEYDIRIRLGDEVGAPCFDNLDCNPDYECIDRFDVYQFPNGLCAKSCQRDSDCGSNRACLPDNFGDNICAQRCDTGFNCRYEFSCHPGLLTNDGIRVSACLSDEF